MRPEHGPKKSNLWGTWASPDVISTVFNPNTSTEELVRIIDTEYVDLVDYIIDNRLITPHILNACAHSSYVSTRADVARHELTPEVTLIKLYDDVDLVKSNLAYNNSTPIHILVKLYKDHYYNLQLAANPSCPPEILHRLMLEQLVHHHNVAELSKYYHIMVNIACNPNTSPHTLKELAKRIVGDSIFAEDIPWEYVLCSNPNTPEPVRLWLRNGGYAGMTLEEFLESTS